METPPRGGRSTRFQPGQSGNPAGRAKLDPALREFCKRKTIEWAEKLAEKAEAENVDPDFLLRVWCEFRNTAWGKPAQAVQLQGNLSFGVVHPYAGEIERAHEEEAGAADLPH